MLGDGPSVLDDGHGPLSSRDEVIAAMVAAVVAIAAFYYVDWRASVAVIGVTLFAGLIYRGTEDAVD